MANPAKIIGGVCEVCKVPEHVLIGPSRAKRIVFARRVATVLMREACMSYPEIAEALRRKSHSSVIALGAGYDGDVATAAYLVRNWIGMRDPHPAPVSPGSAQIAKDVLLELKRHADLWRRFCDFANDRPGALSLGTLVDLARAS